MPHSTMTNDEASPSRTAVPARLPQLPRPTHELPFGNPPNEHQRHKRTPPISQSANGFGVGVSRSFDSNYSASASSVRTSTTDLPKMSSARSTMTSPNMSSFPSPIFSNTSHDTTPFTEHIADHIADPDGRVDVTIGQQGEELARLQAETNLQQQELRKKDHEYSRLNEQNMDLLDANNALTQEINVIKSQLANTARHKSNLTSELASATNELQALTQDNGDMDNELQRLRDTVPAKVQVAGNVNMIVNGLLAPMGNLERRLEEGVVRVNIGCRRLMTLNINRVESLSCLKHKSDPSKDRIKASAAKAIQEESAEVEREKMEKLKTQEIAWDCALQREIRRQIDQMKEEIGANLDSFLRGIA